jgi:predicted ester cyclase
MGAGRDINLQAVKDYNNGDVAGMASLYRDDAVLTTPDGRFEGIEAIRESWARQLAAFPGAQVDMRLDVEEGDVVANEWHFRGVNSGTLAMPDGSEVAATGKTVELMGCSVTTIRGGKIASETMYYDNMAAFTQLGLLPS